MRAVGLKLLKNELSKYVRLAAGGETVLVTDRDRVVAELNPPRTIHRKETEEEFLERGAREGWIQRATIRDGSPPPRAPRHLRVPFAQLMRELAEDRADR